MADSGIFEHRKWGLRLTQKERKKMVKKKRNAKKQTPKRKVKINTDEPVHPWRVCPNGKHQVITHPRHNPPSRTHRDGSVSIVHWHCAKNPSGRDQLYPDEIREIAAQHFSSVKNKPCPLSLGFENGSKYDDIIAGWVQYWNEV